jgi:hypothetical protein
MLKNSFSGYYSISNDKTFFLIRGTNLKTESGSSYLWWFNGYNNGGSYKPDYALVRGDGTYLIWNVAVNANLNVNMDFSQPYIPLTNNGTAFINAIGLTSSSADSKATITDIQFLSAEEVAARCPELATSLGVVSLHEVVRLSDGLSCFQQGGQLIIASRKKQAVQITDLSGKRYQQFTALAGTSYSLALPAGCYLINHIKVIIP